MSARSLYLILAETFFFLLVVVSRLKGNEILDKTFLISSVKYQKCMLRYDRNVT